MGGRGEEGMIKQTQKYKNEKREKRDTQHH
jgi:hypothetical protein